MIVYLDKKGLLSLVKGTEPHYGAFEHPLIKKYGTYVGGIGDHWEWYFSQLIEATEAELYEMYTICQAGMVNIQREIIEDEFPITTEQMDNMPEFKFMEDRLGWEMATSINNHVMGNLLKLK